MFKGIYKVVGPGYHLRYVKAISADVRGSPSNRETDIDFNTTSLNFFYMDFTWRRHLLSFRTFTA